LVGVTTISNGAIAGDSQRAWGYKRAAKAVLRIDRDITPLVTANTFKAISGIGPTTDRIAREVIYDGTSTLVEQAVRELVEVVVPLAALEQVAQECVERRSQLEIAPVSCQRYFRR